MILEQLVEKLMQYEINYNWYEICDEYGNVEIDSEARQHMSEDLIKQLSNASDDILEYLENSVEELESIKETSSEQEIIDTKELINDIKQFNEMAEEDNIEME